MRSRSRYAAAAVLVAIVLLVAPSVSLSQAGARSSPVDTAFVSSVDTTLPSAVVLRRVAEALDGHQTGNPAYVVVSFVSPFEVVGVFDSREAAESARLGVGASVSTVGPFQTTFDPGWVMACIHRASVMLIRPRDLPVEPGLGGIPDSVPYCPPYFRVPFERVAKIRMIVQLVGGDSVTIRFPRGTDAVFLTLSAMDKFVFPYYAKVLGIEAAFGMRRDLVSGLPPR